MKDFEKTNSNSFSKLPFEQENKIMLDSGFILDKDTGIYTKKGYGAFICNINSLTLEEEIKKCEEILKREFNNKYATNFLKAIKSGLKLKVGPIAPINDEDAKKGLYCIDYIKKEEKINARK